MEEILPSIRRIISDEPPSKQPAADNWRSDSSRPAAPLGETPREEVSPPDNRFPGDDMNAGVLVTRISPGDPAHHKSAR